MRIRKTLRWGWWMEVRPRDEEEGGGRRRESNEVGRQVRRGRRAVGGGLRWGEVCVCVLGGGALSWGSHYVFHRRVWNPINQAEERRDAERMRSPFTLMRPGRGKRSTTWAPNSRADAKELWQYLHSFSLKHTPSLSSSSFSSSLPLW